MAHCRRSGGSVYKGQATRLKEGGCAGICYDGESKRERALQMLPVLYVPRIGRKGKVICIGVLVEALQISWKGAVLSIVASQVANLGESYLGATLQDKPGYEWMTNDVVNVLNISAGSLLALLLAVFLRT
eukprot:TRINITY_DN3362_c0_g1_i1.p1 TRINITY_DN3362_c0_g1~~TRINITY_DN3362_c0_g1_i1.p1  ORF type:complete len:130 (-),score=20.17 TRINITY_DN3362_c0_g1_i1:566-955(-)